MNAKTAARIAKARAHKRRRRALRAVLPAIKPDHWCGSYCGECEECRRLDDWLKFTNRGRRSEVASRKWRPRYPKPDIPYYERHSLVMDSVEIMKRDVWKYMTYYPQEVKLVARDRWLAS